MLGEPAERVLLPVGRSLGGDELLPIESVAQLATGQRPNHAEVEPIPCELVRDGRVGGTWTSVARDGDHERQAEREDRAADNGSDHDEAAVSISFARSKSLFVMPPSS